MERRGGEEVVDEKGRKVRREEGGEVKGVERVIRWKGKRAGRGGFGRSEVRSVPPLPTSIHRSIYKLYNLIISNCITAVCLAF